MLMQAAMYQPRARAAGFLEEARGRPSSCQLLHSLNVGGAEVLAARLARQLHESYRFVFVCLDELGSLGQELRGEGFEVEVLGRRPGVDWRCMLRLARLLGRRRVDLLHAHQYTPFFYAASARLFGPRVPVMFTEHGRHFPDYPRRKHMLANRLMLRRRDRVIGVGQAVRQALIANEGIPGERISVIYNGVDGNGFSHGSHERERLRREIGVGLDDFLIVQVARLDYLKDHGTALRALGRVVAECPTTKLVLIGAGPERGKIEAEIHQRGLAAHVRLLGLRNDVSRLLPAADLSLLTSISEGIPLTVIEAMNAGLAVVATRVGGVGEIVVDGETGLLAPSGDDLELANHIMRLAANPVLRRSMSERGRTRARSVFSERQMHAEYVRHYQEMLPG